MKKWILGLVMLISVGAMAQPANYINDRVRKRFVAGMFDSTLHVPRFNGSPSLRTGGSTNDGAIAIDTANGVFYFYHNSSWKRANIDTAAAFLTSVYRRNDSVFYVKGGTHTFAYKDSIGTGGGSSDSSYIYFDTTYNRLGTVLSEDTSIVKSLRLQINGSTVTPTETDTTVSYNLTSLTTSLTNGLTLSSGVGKLGGTLTENTTIDLASYSLYVTSTYYPTLSSGIFYSGGTGLIVLGDYAPNHNETNVSIDDANRHIRLNSDGRLLMMGTDSISLTSNSIRFRTLSNFADTTDWKAVVINNTTGEIRRATYWPGSGGGGGGTPTLQEVLATESNIAIIDNTDILPSTSGLDLVFGDAGSTLWNDIVLKGDGTVQMEAQTSTNSKSSLFGVTPDSVQINAYLGQINIDTLRSWSGISDTTYKKVMTWDTRNGRWEYSNWFGSGGGGSPAGNYGNVQLNRNGAFATPASDSLDFDAGLNIIGNLNASKFAWTGNSLYPTLTLSGSDPLIYFGGTGAAYPSFGAGSGSDAAIYGSSGAKSISFYDQLISGKQMLRLYTSVGQTAAVFNKTVITVDTMVGGPSTGSIHAEASAGDSTSLSTGINTHMYRGIAKQYANTNAVNTFYGTVIYTNTNSGATGDHIVNWQSDAKKTGASTLDIIYHSAYLGDSIIAGIVNKRYGIKYWDAYLNTGAQLGSQMAFKTDKLKAAAGLNFHFLADSSHYAQLDGNILLGDSVVASSARKTLHIFNGTAPSASVANGVILYAEDVSSSSELKVRDEAGNITTLSPHNFSLIPGGKSEDMAWAFYSERDGKKVNVDMMKLARLVEKLTGEKLVYIQ